MSDSEINDDQSSQSPKLNGANEGVDNSRSCWAKAKRVAFKGLTFMAWIGLAMIIFLGISLLPELAGGKAAGVAGKVKGNMYVCQSAVETFGKAHSGNYPLDSNDRALRCYFPGGHVPDIEGEAPVNPISKLPEWPVVGTVHNVTDARNHPSFVGKGVVEYSVIFDTRHNPISYAIRAGGLDGQAVQWPTGKALVLSNQ